MSNSGIWVVLFARPKNNLSLRPLNDERFRVGADIMYLRRFGQAQKMKAGDRVVIQFGGPKGSDPLAGYLFLAGFVDQEARNLTPQDKTKYKRLIELTVEMFPEIQLSPGLWERQGIIGYRLFSLSPDMLPIFRPYPQLKPGDNFKKFLPETPEFPILDEWWRKVVPNSESKK
jgi:hypothetical protein